jgi:hypothetical protein
MPSQSFGRSEWSGKRGPAFSHLLGTGLRRGPTCCCLVLSTRRVAKSTPSASMKQYAKGNKVPAAALRNPKGRLKACPTTYCKSALISLPLANVAMAAGNCAGSASWVARAVRSCGVPSRSRSVE